MYLIKNVHIVLEHEILPEASILIQGEHIVSFGTHILQDMTDIEQIDGKGYYLAPGLIDIHGHGNSGFDITDGTEQAFDKMSRFLLTQGVTSFLGTVMTAPYEVMLRPCKTIASYTSSPNQSRLLGLHIEGPFLNPEKSGAQPTDFFKLPNTEFLSSLINSSKHKIKMVTVAPELENSESILKMLKEEKITIALGHSNATFAQAHAAIEQGATVGTHLFNAMRTIHHREPGIVTAMLNSPKTMCELIYDRIHVHDEVVRLALRAKGVDGLIAVSDAMAATGLGNGEYRLGTQIVHVKDGVSTLPDGNLAGSTLTLLRAVQNFVKHQEVSLCEAIKMASLNPARAIGLEAVLGSIAPQKIADLILLDKNLNLQGVILSGQIQFL